MVTKLNTWGGRSQGVGEGLLAGGLGGGGRFADGRRNKWALRWEVKRARRHMDGELSGPKHEDRWAPVVPLGPANMYMLASSAADVSDWKTPFFGGKSYIIYELHKHNVLKMCLYFFLISRGCLSSRFKWNINVSCGSLISYGVEENQKLFKKLRNVHHRTASWQRGRRTTQVCLRCFSRLPKNRNRRNKFRTLYQKGEKAELRSRCFRAFDPHWSVSLSGENLQHLSRPHKHTFMQRWRLASSFNTQVCVFTFYLFIMGEEKPLIMQHFKLWQWNETLVGEVGTYRHFFHIVSLWEHVFWRRRASADVLIGCFFCSQAWRHSSGLGLHHGECCT